MSSDGRLNVRGVAWSVWVSFVVGSELEHAVGDFSAEAIGAVVYTKAQDA